MFTKPRKCLIPDEFLLQMGTCDVTIHGDKLTTHVLNCATAVDNHIADIRSYLECNGKVVGFDVKELQHRYPANHAIILCVSRRCLIIHVHYACDSNGKTPESLINFLKDPKICFVGVNITDLSRITHCYRLIGYSTVRSADRLNVGVKVGELAARVLKKPALIDASLADIAHQVGVAYNGPTSATAKIKMDSRNTKVFTDEHVVAAVSDACAYYQIGYKLLASP